MTANQVAADLRAAADVLERDGWTQGAHRNPADGCRCASGAVAFVVSGQRTSQPGRLELDGEYDRWAGAARLLRQVVGDDSIVNFNDTPGRTAAEVIAALRAAADRAEADQ